MTFHDTPHGTDVFGSHWNCQCDKCEPRRKAVHRLVDSFSQIPARWIEKLSHDSDLDGPIALPMWGTLFAPNNPADVSNITNLLKKFEPNIDNDEMATLALSGWQEVADTGIYAREFDDELLLGIHGAGYDFYDHHWSKLYDALGYQWHD
ncbi:MAG: hypothetical protein KDA84_07755 [Planctomycetaceae bacterium]|nr:hypothetical protein [Planctomycetaceae bacterium]